MAGVPNAGEIRAKMTLELGDFHKKVKQAKGDIDDLKDAGKKAHHEFGLLNKAAYAAGLAVSTGFGAAIITGMNFEAQMSRVGAISGATEDQLKALTAEAMRLGSETPKSATEVAKGMELMAAAGFKVNDIIAAMPGIISASVASGEDMARVTEVVTAALNAFHLQASESSRVADVLAQAANDSAAGINDMGYAFKYAAPIAYQLGYSIEDLAAAVEIMANNGIKGEQAGTTLRMGLLRLAAPTKKAQKLLEELGIQLQDTHGKMLPLEQIIDQLREKTAGLTDAQKAHVLQVLFGTEALSGMMTLVNAAPGQYEKLIESLKQSAGASEEAAKKMQDNLKGAVEQLGGAAETAAISFYDGLSPALKDAVQKLTEFLNKLTQSGAIKQFGQALGEMISFLASSEGRFLLVASAVGLLGTRIAGAIIAVGGFTRALAALRVAILGTETALGPTGWIIAGLSILAGLWASNAMEVDNYTAASTKQLKTDAERLVQIDRMVSEFENLRSKSKLTNDEFERAIDIQAQLAKETNPEKQKELAKELDSLQKKSGLNNKEFSQMLDLNNKIAKAAPEAAGGMTKLGNAVVENTDKYRKLNEQQREFIRLQLQSRIDNGMANRAKWAEEIARYEKAAADHQREYARQIGLAQQQRERIFKTEQEIAAARARGDSAEVSRLEARKNAEEFVLKQIEKQVAKEEELVKKNLASKSVSEAKLKALQNNLETMKQVLLAEAQSVDANLKSKKAIEDKVKAIDDEIAKLKKVKTNNEDEKKAIAEQIKQLEGKKGKLAEILKQLGLIEDQQADITGETKKTGNQIKENNKELGKKIKKPVDNSDIDAGKKKADELNSKIADKKKKPVDRREIETAVGLTDGLNDGLTRKVKKPVDGSSITTAMDYASDLNSRLSKPIKKEVTIVQFIKNIVQEVKQLFHHGGIVKRHSGGPMPMPGGIVPGNEEVLARLMGGEMVLTRHQQAKLWKLINDATTFATRNNIAGGTVTNSEPILLQSHVTVELDKRVLGQAVDEVMYDRENTKLRAKGINGQRRSF